MQDASHVSYLVVILLTASPKVDGHYYSPHSEKEGRGWGWEGTDGLVSSSLRREANFITVCLRIRVDCFIIYSIGTVPWHHKHKQTTAILLLQLQRENKCDISKGVNMPPQKDSGTQQLCSLSWFPPLPLCSGSILHTAKPPNCWDLCLIQRMRMHREDWEVLLAPILQMQGVPASTTGRGICMWA